MIPTIFTGKYVKFLENSSETITSRINVNVADFGLELWKMTSGLLETLTLVSSF